ncbi:MAG: nuclear transport factor 2 family protein [Betaproteobacteria bacterium]|nr:nuclear transport factor 2 family protein [Betaproteobacteria bacterium]
MNNDQRLQQMLDRHEIATLVQNWGFWRDAGDWERLRTTFHPEGTICVTWFSGLFSAFLAGSMEMRKTRSRAKHSMGATQTSLKGHRAIAESNAFIMNRVVLHGVEVDSMGWGRFYDRLEKREGVWRILKRDAIYEKDRIDPVVPGVRIELDMEKLQRFPEGYRYIAYSLASNGFESRLDLPTNGSPELATLKAEGEAWLAAAPL